MDFWIYDIETYPNVFSFIAEHSDHDLSVVFEISDRKDDSQGFKEFLKLLRERNATMVGYNNIGFDYPIIHKMLQKGMTAQVAYEECQRIINSQSNDRFSTMVWESDHVVRQLDLYKIHHFDNMAKSTSLKVLEFNMKSESIEDLPYEPGVSLASHEIDLLLKYNHHDVKQTKKFFNLSIDEVKFRRGLEEVNGKNYDNYNDTKIGKDFFI